MQDALDEGGLNRSDVLARLKPIAGALDHLYRGGPVLHRPVGDRLTRGILVMLAGRHHYEDVPQPW